MKRPKVHSIAHSSFFRLGRKKDLADLLGVSTGEIKRLSSDTNYKEWTKRSKDKKPRLIEEPLPALDRLQRRIHHLIKRVQTPEWLRSGKFGSKSQENAAVHGPDAFVITADIESFYQSTRREYVYRCLVREFEMKNDIASLLADAVTYKGHIPTGTATSQLFAFWAYKQTFERIQALCARSEIKITLWVDDITFSRKKPFPEGWTRGIDKILKEVQLKLKVAKTKRYTAADNKVITGSVLTPNGGIRVRNAKQKEILDILAGRRVEDLSLKEVLSLFGKVSSQRQNESAFFDGIHRRCKEQIRVLRAQIRP